MIDLNKEEVLHTLLAVNAFAITDDGFSCEVCSGVAKKLEAETRRLYELPADVVLLEIPEAYKALGVTKWEKVIGKDD
jgi:hypothetical protein